jgi:uncharacterized membrane protein
MSGATRLLLIGGVSLGLLSMGYGLWYAAFAEHQALDQIAGSLTSAFVSAANRDAMASQQALEQYREAKYSYDRRVDAHSHWIGLSLLLIVIAIGFDRLGLSERLKWQLALALLLGSFLFPLGVLLETLNKGAFPQTIAVVGSALVIAALAGSILGFLRPGPPQSSART